MQNVGLWFAIGIIVGILLELGGRWFFEWWFRPIIKIPKDNEEVWWETATDAGLHYFDIVSTPVSKKKQVAEGITSDAILARQGFKDQTVSVYRLKVKNEGRRAAENVAGTVEFKSQYDQERRICWYEGNVPTITLNTRDHSFLDVYGVLLSQGNTICMPTENGWKELYPIALKEKVKISLRVTAKNARPYTVNFEIDPENQCKPYWLE